MQIALFGAQNVRNPPYSTTSQCLWNFDLVVSSVYFHFGNDEGDIRGV